MSGRCLASVWWVSRRCLEGVWKVSEWCLDPKFSRPNLFWAQIFLGVKFFGGVKFFLFQHIQTKPSQTKLALSLAQLSPSLFLSVSSDPCRQYLLYLINTFLSYHIGIPFLVLDSSPLSNSSPSMSNTHCPLFLWDRADLHFDKLSVSLFLISPSLLLLIFHPIRLD